MYCVTSFPLCAPAASSVHVTDTGTRTMEAACHPAVRWTGTERETVTVSRTESGRETERETGTGREKEAGTETGIRTVKGRENEAEKGNETTTWTGRENEMDHSDVSNHLLVLVSHTLQFAVNLSSHIGRSSLNVHLKSGKRFMVHAGKCK